jgi:geranylgeranyl pyrophosphate synthase
MPWIYSNYNLNSNDINDGINKMRNIAKQFGLIFQISDDFEDVEQDMKRDGKNSVMNYVINKGYYDAYNDYYDIVKKFNELTENENIRTKEMDQMINYLSKKVDVYYKDQEMR